VTSSSLPGCRDGQLVLAAPSARSLLLTVAGEMLRDREEGVWTTALLRVFAGLGVEDHATRQLLARSAAAGWVTRERAGRGVRWRLADRGRELVVNGVRRSELYLGTGASWDGTWLVLYVTLPQHQRTTRKRLYGGLTWLGMGNPTPGVWVTPHAERAEELGELVSALELDDTAFAVVGQVPKIGMPQDQLVERSWELAELRAHYATFIEQERTAPAPADADGVLLSYLALLSLQQRFMRRDPMLPAELLSDWVGRDGAALFGRLRAEWADGAHRRFWEIADASAPA
jgi:phenylacetic acid degradation operon negative regulatory protein